ncbi:MAG: Gfo/Idh/MocA family oxidoreductase [Collimonas sp.]|uniref:Gfo/Idh/MocA family protein n=1 Tax=Collimonas sp. TaxID=1963772 RepID=UPI0032662BBA
MIRWAIVGSGGIAERFADDFQYVRGAELAGVFSRRPESAQKFAARFKLAHSYASLDALLEADIDAVYIATPHIEHPSYAIACLQAGLAVLSEKPAAPNLAQLESVLAVAEQHKVLFMEAMKPAFYPLYRQIKMLLDDGAIGEVNFVDAGFSYLFHDRAHKVFDPAQAGGSLLDVGIYPAFLACDLLGPALQVKALLDIGASGVDEAAVVSTRHAHGMSNFFCGMRSASDGRAMIGGSKGHLVIEGKWWNPCKALLVRESGVSDILSAAYLGDGLCHETQHFTDLLRDGKTRSEIMHFDLSRAMIRTLDMARADAGLRFPFE